ncbi:MAG: hypothetical protein IJW03_00975 [Clostridia bacterium]|nr:hypothetical protein [Clostridia bacterium]
MTLTKIPMIHNLELIKNITPEYRYDGKQSFEGWQKEARAKLRELVCLDAIERAEDNLFNLEYKKECDGYTEYRFTVSSEVGYHFPCVLRIPHGVKAPIPTYICLQGHSTGFHMSLGEPKFPGDAEGIKGDRDFVVRANAEGYAAIAVEQRNFGECGSNPKSGDPQCHVSSMTNIINGRTTIAERIADISCVIDVIEEHFKELDSENVVLMGHSGGGTATYYAACLDERIKLAVASGSVCTYKDSIAAMHHCVCNFIPNIAKYFDMGDLGGLIAPRKLIVVNGESDNIFPKNGVYESYDIIKKMYEAAGVPENCAHVEGNGGHRFYADPTWPIIHKFYK